MSRNYYIKTDRAEIRLVSDAATCEDALNEIRTIDTPQSGEAHIHEFKMEFYTGPDGHEHPRELHNCDTCKMK